MKNIFVVVFTFIALQASAQTADTNQSSAPTENKRTSKEPVTVACIGSTLGGRYAYFPGENDNLYRWLSENLQYSNSDIKRAVKRATKRGHSCLVSVKFIVEKDGCIRDATIVQSAGSILDEEAMRVVQEMPKWYPAIQANEYGIPNAYAEEVHIISIDFKTQETNSLLAKE